MLSGNLFTYGSNQRDKGKEVVLNILVGLVFLARWTNLYRELSFGQ